MLQVGLFIIADPKPNFMKRKIFNSLMGILDNNLDNIAFTENENGDDMLFTFLSLSDQEKIFNLFEKYGILISYKNLTKSFLYQKDLHSIFVNGDFKNVLINFLENSLDKDTILDKINDLGIESLNEVDYKILGK